MKFKKLIGAATLLLSLVGSHFVAAQSVHDVKTAIDQQLLSQRTAIARNYEALIEQGRLHGKIQIIAKLNVLSDDYSLQDLSPEDQTEFILQELKKRDLVAIKSLPSRRLSAFEVTSEELDQMLDSGLVEVVYENSVSTAQLNNSIPHIGANIAHNQQLTGAGQAVVIMDSGMEITHPFLQGRVVEGACFSTNNSVATSLCPNGGTFQTGLNAPTGCGNVENGCTHATHVAGIAAGQNPTMNGVAPDANIVAVNVFSQMERSLPNCTEDFCLTSYAFDQIEALEWVLNKALTNNIAAINMSLGNDDQWFNSCNNDPRVDVIRDLRNAGILTVISSGNDGHTNGVDAPSCIADAITVGSTMDNTDVVNGFSNSGPLVDVLAPGANIESSAQNGTYQVLSGTSMAAPHVTGAIALMRSADPSLTANEIENLLETHGQPVVDPRNNREFPRLDLYATLLNVDGGAVPEPPVPVEADLEYGDMKVTWVPVNGSTRYDLEEQHNGGSWRNIPGIWHPQSEKTVHDRAAGTYIYQMRSCSNNGCSAQWVQSNTVQVLDRPASVTAVPNGSRVDVTWDPVIGASNYQYSSKFNGGSWSTGQNISNNRVIYTGRNPGLYEYRVSACVNGDCSKWQNSDTVRVLERPGPVNASVDINRNITVTWNLVTGAGEYERQVYTSDRPDLGWRNSKYYNSTTNVAVFPNQQTGRTYRYRIRACASRNTNCTAWVQSSQTVDIPEPPASLNPPVPVNATVAPNRDVTISWQSVPGVGEYERQVYTSDLPNLGWRNSSYYGSSQTSVVFPNQQAGRSYQYRVRACVSRNVNCSPWAVSNTISIN